MSRKIALVSLSLLIICIISLAVNEISGTSKTDSVEVDGKRIVYTVTAGLLPVFDNDGNELARIFSVSYERMLDDEDSSRPITFAFNGGPGAAAMFLHLGAFGPRVVERSGDGTGQPVPPFKLVDNPFTLLDITDLVFIDPVGTGYTEVVNGIDPRKFWDVKEDVAVIGEFIQSYLDARGRRRSPIYILGESYGGVRGSYLAEHLQDIGVYPSGLIFISPVLDLGTIQWSSMEDKAFALSIPAYVASAWYHGKVYGELETLVEEASRWVKEEYLRALWEGNNLADDRKRSISETLEKLTGISSYAFYERDLRMSQADFSTLLLEEMGRSLSVYDSRITAIGPYVGDSNDGTMFNLSGQLKTCANDYIKREIGYDTNLPYKSGNAEVYLNWNWESGVVEPEMPDSLNLGFPDASSALSDALTRAPYLKVFIAGGRFDLECPFESVSYSIDHLKISDSLRDNIIHKVYEGGHMIYVNPEALEELKKDLRFFYEN
ncbi:MAG TPA: hypothetical protein ENN47_11610 [Mesotoga infera]|uniref:Peptidase S10 n=1 Tax=Mesotoga infera TaxID=1236046 RepID=A0A7C1CWL8_9BACT|nr:hypothetical protein [Mesotoga infera]